LVANRPEVMNMHNIYPASELSVKEIEDLFFYQTKQLSRKTPARRY
jgi:hypothetical protein